MKFRDFFNEPKVVTQPLNGWNYVMQETCQGVRVTIIDPQGKRFEPVTLPGKKNPLLSPNL